MPVAAALAARALLLALLASAPACASLSADGPAAADLAGARVEVLGTWEGVERERFEEVLADFARRTGARPVYVEDEDRLAELLAERLAAGRPPDLAFLPQPGLLRELARDGHLVPADDATERAVRRQVSAVLRGHATDRGVLYGVWFKAANKSLVWYDVAAFERLGVAPPRDLDGLRALVARLGEEGVPAFAVAGRDGWTLTDWFENLFARRAGLAAYDALAGGRLAWTDPSVAAVLGELLDLLAPESVAGGAEGALATGFADSVRQVFTPPARAAMVMEGDFVAGVVTSSTPAVLGVDADVFPFPAGRDGETVVVGGGDVAVRLTASPAGAALQRYLTTTEAAAVWARHGGFVSPNVDLDPAVYPDDVSRRVALGLLEAGEDFRFDLSDLQPPAFGSAADAGLAGELRALLAHRDVPRACAALDAAARVARGEAP
jgi:alpha-glucoside transport system substrate-binding protein